MDKFNINRKIKLILTLLIIITIFGFSNKYCLAEDATSFVGNDVSAVGSFIHSPLAGVVTLIVGFLAYMITAVVGLLITVLVNILVGVAQFNQIISQQVVVEGWVIIRDICNMFFVVILLVIAFGTILKVNNNTYSLKTLPKLLLMAVLINFSRTIFGLIIDASQVVMLTFVNAFSEGGGHFINMFKVNRWFTSNSSMSGGDSQWGTVMAMIAGVIAAVITLIIMGVMVAILMVRIVMLWIYTILSPLILLGFAFQPLQKYTGELWQDFIKYVTVGPILAFFIWLALLTASLSVKTDDLFTNNPGLCVGVSSFFCSGELAKFIMVIAFLWGGMMIAQKTGGMAGKIAGKGMAMAKGVAGGIVKGSAKLGGAAALTVAGGGLGLLGKIPGLGRVGTGLKMAGNLGTSWGSDIRAGMNKTAKEKRQKLLKTMGFGEKSSDAGKKILDTNAGRAVGNMALGAMAGGGVGGLLGAAGGAVLALGITLGGDSLSKYAKDIKDDSSGKYSSFQKWLAGKAQFVGEYGRDFATKDTNAAWGEISKEKQNARKQMGPAGTDPTFWRDGDAKYNKAFMETLAEDTTASIKARAAAETWIKGIDPNNEKQVAKARDLAKNLAKYKNVSGSDMTSFTSLVNEVNLLQGRVATGTLPADKGMKKVEDYADDKLSYRKTGKEGIQGTGKANIVGVSQFVKGKDVADVPLARMSRTRALARKNGGDIDVEADAMHLNSPEMIEAAKQDMEEYYASEIARIKATKPDEVGEGKEFKSAAHRDKTLEYLGAAQAKAQSAFYQPENLDIINSAGMNYGLVERKTSATHEAYHKYVKNEDLTESLTQQTRQTGNVRSVDHIGRVAAEYEAEMKASGVNINADNADIHAQEIMRRAEASFGNIISEINKAFTRTGGKEISVSDLSPKARKMVEEYQFNSMQPQIAHHEDEIETWRSIQDDYKKSGNAQAAAEIEPEIQANQKAIDRLKKQATKRTFAMDDPIIQEVIGDLENQKASFGSRADKAIAKQNSSADVDGTDGEVAADRARSAVEKEIVVNIPEMEGFREALADFKTGTEKSGGGIDSSKIEQLLTGLNYNMFQMLKVLTKQSAAGGPIKEMMSGEDENGEKKETVPLDIAVVSQAVEAEVNKA